MVDTASLSNRINLKLNISDTSSLARKTTTITPTAPLTGGGSLAANRTISIPKATASADGYLSATDFNRFAGVLNNVIAREPLYRFKYYGGTSSYNPDSIAINIRQANDTTNGYVSSSSFLTFGNKVDSVYKIGDTLYVINGNKDIIPTSRTKKYYLGGIAIDTTNRFVNNVIKINDSTFRVFKGSSSSDIYLKSSIDTISLSNRIDNKVPYTGAIKDVDLDIYKLAAQSIMVNGTNGNGHIDLKRQNADATATGQSTVLFANSNGDLKWKYSGTTYTTLQTRQTADRVYSFQNKSYTLGDSADVAGKLNIADTSDMLFKYLRRSDTTSMLSKYLRKTDTASLSNRINLKVNISDTAGMLTNYAKTNLVNTKLNSSDSTIYFSKYRSDTMRTNIYSAINGKQASGTYITSSDTSVFQRKNIAAYSFVANSTPSAANMTTQTFKDTTGTYTGTIAWTGTTAPTTATATFRYVQIGRMVTLTINVVYTTAGTALTQAIIPFMANFPTPTEPSGFGAASDFLFHGSGLFVSGLSTMPSLYPRAFIRANAADNGYDLIIGASAGVNVKAVYTTIIYFTN